mgnify:CR=1 FL=1
MWPKLSNIEDKIYNNITSGEKTGMDANSRVAWIRVFSGATLSVGGTKDVTDKNGNVTKEKKTKIAEGLIMSSAQVSKIFKAAGETIFTNNQEAGSKEAELKKAGVKYTKSNA